MVEVLSENSLGGLKVEKVGEAPSLVNMLIYGEPGVGKTILAGSASEIEAMGPVLFIDIEGGTMSLRNKFPDVDVVRVSSWADMLMVYNDLQSSDKYRTVVLDSLTEIQKFSMYHIMKDLLESDPDRDPDVPGLREWGKNSEQVRRFVRAFRDLPVNTIFTALAATDKDPKTGEFNKDLYDKDRATHKQIKKDQASRPDMSQTKPDGPSDDRTKRGERKLKARYL